MEPVVVASKDGPAPEIELRFEQQNGGYFGKYSILLFDPAGLNPIPVGAGINTDQINDQFTLPGPNPTLNGKIVSWEVIVAAFDSGNVGSDFTVPLNPSSARDSRTSAMSVTVVNCQP